MRRAPAVVGLLTCCRADAYSIFFDPEKNRLTGITNWQNAHVGSQADEYLLSLRSFGWQVSAPDEDGDGEDDSGQLALLRSCLLLGFDKALKNTDPNGVGASEPVNWAVAKAFDKALEAAAVERPVKIDGIAELASVYWFIRDVCPPTLLEYYQQSTDNVEDNDGDEDDEDIAGLLEKTASNLEWYLDKWGFDIYVGPGGVAMCKADEDGRAYAKEHAEEIAERERKKEDEEGVLASLFG